MRLRIIALVLIGLGFFAWGYLATSRHHSLPQGQLRIQVAPLESTIFLDGSSIEQGEKHVDIGEHHIKVSLDGFKTYEKTVNVTQASETYVGVILNPSSKDTSGWFNEHPNDQKQSEAINDQLADANSARIGTNHPIFARLPVVFGNGAGGLTKIEAEAPLGDADKPTIGIYASTPQGRQAALDWIYNRNYTIDNLNVVFHSTSIPINSGVPE